MGPVKEALSTPKALSTDSSRRGGSAWRTILFNCGCHTFDEVERQIMRAIRCGLARARELSWQAHAHGQAPVYDGPRERCEAVAAVLEAIGLRAKVER